MCALYKAYNGERAWKDMRYYRSRVDHCWKIRSRKIRIDVGKFNFVNRTIADPIGYLKGHLGLASLKRMYSEKGLGKYINVK
jgi:hypothetical protein